MTSHTNAVFSVQPGNTYLNGIWWNTQQVTTGNTQTVITYAANPTYQPNAVEMAAYTQIFADISRVCNITFVAGNAAGADIVMNSGSGAQMSAAMGGVSPTALGIAEPPGTSFDNGGDEESWDFVNRDQH